MYLSVAPVGNYNSVSIYAICLPSFMTAFTSHLENFLFVNLFIGQLGPVADELVRCVSGDIGKLPIKRSKPMR